MKRENSGLVARERLKCVLREDRSRMSGTAIAAMREDLIRVLSGYAGVRDEDVTFYLLRGGSERESRLMLEAKITARPNPK